MAKQFDHEKLDVYQLELRFIAWADTLLEAVEKAAGKRVRHVIDHLDRASLSMLFNTAEGNGKRQRYTRGKFFDDASGSTGECAGCLDAFVAKRSCTTERIEEGKQMLVRVFEMLTKLVDRYSTGDRVGEEDAHYERQAPRSRADREEEELDDDDEDDDDKKDDDKKDDDDKTGRER